jgi:hypothetical protein
MKHIGFDKMQVVTALKRIFGKFVLPVPEYVGKPERSDWFTTNGGNFEPINLGDVISVKERWSPDNEGFYPHFPIVYEADDPIREHEIEGGKVFSQETKTYHQFKWRSSGRLDLHNCRIKIKITGIRVIAVNMVSDLIASECGMVIGINPTAVFDVRWVAPGVPLKVGKKKSKAAAVHADATDALFCYLKHRYGYKSDGTDPRKYLWEIDYVTTETTKAKW